MTAHDEARATDLEHCQSRLAEAEAILDAIRRGRIDALVVDSPEGSRIFTVAGAERPYRVFIEQMGEGAGSLSSDGKVLFANRQFADMLRLPQDTVAGRNLCDFLSSEDAARFRSSISSRSSEHMRTELTLRRDDGSQIPVHLSASVFEDDGLHTICAIVTDLTEQKKREEQLRQTQKLEAIGQLTTGIAHDFNNLLTAILGNLDLLQRRVKEDEALARVRSATQSARRGAKLIEQLLAFARKQHLVPEPVNVNRVVTDVLDLIERTIGPTIELVTRLDGDVLEACADATQIEMMVVNLALNARDAMPGGGSIRIETAALTVSGDTWAPADLTPGEYVRLSVIDTGAGMTQETMAKAIEPFYTTKPPGAGSGLGLSQVYGAAKQFGGAIQIGSRLGQGTSVHVYLPRVKTEGQQARQAEPDDTAPGGPVQQALVLVVDDDPEVRELSADLVRALGHRTLEAASAARALALLRQDRGIDILFSDVAMPNMNGFELAMEARNLRPGLPVLLMTGYADFAELEAGSLRWPILKKPFRMGDLEPVLGRLLRDRTGKTA